MVRRKLTGVVTPATQTEGQLEPQAVYLMAIAEVGRSITPRFTMFDECDGDASVPHFERIVLFVAKFCRFVRMRI